MTLEQLNIKNGDIITARRIDVREFIRPDPLIDEEENLKPEVYEMFNMWFNLFMDPEKGKMTTEGAQAFIYEMTTDYPDAKDNRVQNLFKEYAKPDDQEHLDREGFIGFFHEACKTRVPSVYENMENMLVRPDMKRYSDVEEENALQRDEMPRYLISENAE